MLASRMIQTQEVAVGLCSKIHSKFKTVVRIRQFTPKTAFPGSHHLGPWDAERASNSEQTFEQPQSNRLYWGLTT